MAMMIFVLLHSDCWSESMLFFNFNIFHIIWQWCARTLFGQVDGDSSYKIWSSPEQKITEYL